MPEQTAFRQVDEKHVSVEVDFMVWSPKFDLVALSNVQGEVVLHRLSWQKVWSLPPPTEDVRVKAMAWRCDGKVLGVGYNSGRVNLCYIENADILHTFEVPGEVTCMSWMCQAAAGNEPWSSAPYLEDNTDLYLPRLQPLTKSYGTLNKGNVEENVEDRKKLKDQKELNLLVVGSTNHQLHLFAYGVFPVAVISVGEQNGTQPRHIQSVMLSHDLHSLVVFLQMGRDDSPDQDYSLVTFDTTLLASRQKELRLLALKYGQISTLTEYLQTTIQQMSEAWEDILMEMDSKLLKFAEGKKKSGTGTVSNDFLELLLFGTPSVELQAFLLNDLTDKGLKKLGQSIETSYSNIQKLVVKHLQSVSQAILYHLSELKGMSVFYEKFGVLGLDPQSLQEAVTKAGSFLLKTSELQQVIDGSIKNIKAFFRWLYVVILRLSDEKPPPELSKMTQYDINFVADFLRDNFAQFSATEEESISELQMESKPRFKLEKVGQYMKKEDLHYPPDISGNPWTHYLRASVHLKDSQTLYPAETSKSLIQMEESLQSAIDASLSKPSMIVGQSMECVSSMFLFTMHNSDDDKPTVPRVTQFTAGTPSMVYTVFTTDPTPCQKLYILKQPTDSRRGNVQIAAVTFGSLLHGENETSMESDIDRCEHHKVLDVSSYDDKILSVLLVEDTEDQVPVLMQLPLLAIPDSTFINLVATAGINMNSDIPVLEVGSLVEPGNYRRLQNMKAHSFAVSGSRHTATVLFSSRRRVRIFLMDAEEEDEEEEEEEEEVDGADQSNQSEADFNQSNVSVPMDSTSCDDQEENKENTSLISQGTENG